MIPLCKNLLYITLTMQLLNAQHTIPKSIEKEALLALSHYPELTSTTIAFQFKKKLRTSIMKAQPVFKDLLRSKRKRRYRILISERFQLGDSLYETKNLSSEILVGWLGHELGHVLDYKNRSSLNLLGFGLGYTFSGSFIKKAERTADSFAVSHGLSKQILAAKNFILTEAGIAEKYRNRIKRLYLSPDEIMIMAQEFADKAKD